MAKKYTQFLGSMSEQKTLNEIRQQVVAGTKDVIRRRAGKENKETVRGKSQLVLNAIHHVDAHLDGCNNAEGPCLQALVEKYVTEQNGSKTVQVLEKLLPVLYLKPNVLAKWFSDISKIIQNKFPESKISAEAKKKLHLPLEAAILRRKNYEAKVYQVNVKQRQITDSQVIKAISELQEAKDWPSLAVCVALSVGSRASEIMMVSTYEGSEHPQWIKITGVSKDRSEGGKIVEKPVVGGMRSAEVISMVGEIRQQVSDAYDYDLGTGSGSRIPDKKQITASVDAKLNQRMRDTFGVGFVFHDTRSMYAELAFTQFAPSAMSKTAFFSSVLGHKEESLTTALSYQKFSLKRKLPEVDPDISSRVTIMEEKQLALQEYVRQEVKKAKMAQLEFPEVYLPTPDGEILTFKKQPRLRNGDNEGRMRRIEEAVSTLEQNGISPTRRVLLKLGFGSTIISAWAKARKANEAQ